MATLYELSCGYTKLGIGTAPSSAPTITVVDSANNVLVAALTAVTALTNLPGAYRYSYSGNDGLIVYGLFHTSDLTMDQYDIFATALVDPGVRDIQARLPAALTANGNMKSSLLEMLTSALTETSGGYLAAGLKKLLDVATPLMTVAAQPAVSGDAMDLIVTLKHISGTSGYDRTTDSMEALGEKPNIGAKMNLVDELKNKVGATGYDRTTDSLEGIADKATSAPILGEDGKVLISTDAQDLSGSLDVNAKKLGGATPNNAAAAPTAASVADAVRDEVALKAVAPVAGSIGKLISDNLNAPVGSIPTNPLLANSTLLPASVIAAKSDLPAAAPSAASNADAIWNEVLAGHVGAGSTGKALADAGGNASVAISSIVAAAVSTGSMAVEAGYTLRQVITSTLASNLSGATKLWLAVKRSSGEEDATSLVYLEKTGGLTIVNGITYATIAHGSLTVTGSAGAWSITVYLDEVATALLFGKNIGCYAGLKALIGVDTVSVWEGMCSITDGIVRAVA